jgi:hypothetical protein
MRCEERERDRHIDLTHTAFLACRDLLDANHRALYDLVTPATALGDRADGPCPTFDPDRANFVSGHALRHQDFREFREGGF